MSGRRWIIVDERVSREDSLVGIDSRYFGASGEWNYTVRLAGTFNSRADAAAKIAHARRLCENPVVRPVRPAGTKRTADPSQALAAATARAETAEREALALRNGGRIYELETELRLRRSQADGARELLGRVLAALGAPQGGDVVAHAFSVAHDRDTAQRERDEARAGLDSIRAAIEMACGGQAATMNVRSRRVSGHSLPLPSYAHLGDAGLDLAAMLAPSDAMRVWGGHAWTPCDAGTDAPRLTLAPGARALIPCGFAFAIPDGFEGQVRPRSSGFKLGLHVPLGTIDSGYRGEVLVGVWNLGDDEVDINHGDRIAQLVIAPVARVELREVDTLDDTVRGEGGFGSTGR